jgi:hypothetical protein
LVFLALLPLGNQLFFFSRPAIVPHFTARIIASFLHLFLFPLAICGVFFSGNFRDEKMAPIHHIFSRNAFLIYLFLFSCIFVFLAHFSGLISLLFNVKILGFRKSVREKLSKKR